MSKKHVGANRKQTEKAREIRTGKSAQRVWILSGNEEKKEIKEYYLLILTKR